MSRSAQERLSAFWDSSRAYYEQASEVNAELAPERTFLLEHLRGDERLLDLGCGSCENALWIPRDCRYVGTDLSTTALVMAEEAGRPGSRTRSDGARLPFADRSFDAVLSTWALEHLHDPGATLREVARVLRPSGVFLLVSSAWDLPYEMPPSLDPGRRLEVALRRLGRQLQALVTAAHLFDTVSHPRVLDDGYLPDSDAVFVVQSYFTARFLQELGFEIQVHRSLRHRPDPSGLRGVLRRLLRRFPLWRRGWGNLLIVARRLGAADGVPRAPRYRLAPL